MATGLPSYTEDLNYPAYQDRLILNSLVQPGVMTKEDLKVLNSSGLQVAVQSGRAYVEQTGAIEESSNAFFNGLYFVPISVAAQPYNSVEVSSVNPQIAQIILRVYDVNELKIGGSSFARLEWLNGTPTASATETKMKEGKYEGVATLSQSSLILARVLVPKNATTSSEYYIEDARTFGITGAWKTFASFGTSVSAEEAGPWQSPRIRSEDTGTVARMRGAALCVASLGLGATVFTLPIGLRPPATVIVPFSYTTGGGVMTVAQLVIPSTGVANVASGTSASGFIHLDGITFNLT